MNQTHSLAWAVDYYLKSRRQLGFALRSEQWALTGLVRYAQRTAHRGPLTCALAIGWAQSSPPASPPQWACRLNMVRRFARFWRAFDPRTELPPAGFFGPAHRRRPVHIYTAQELRALLQATTILGPAHGLRAAGTKTVLGLLACTGLRVSEALHLRPQDIDWSNGLLTIHRTKSGQARLIPLEASALAALRAYQRARNGAHAPACPEAFFISSRAHPLPYETLRDSFLKLRRHLGWNQLPRPRLHDLRHTFAVNCLVRWFQQRQPIGQHVLTLSTYLGHRQVTDTYWYLSAVPQLLSLASNRFQSHATAVATIHE